MRLNANLEDGVLSPRRNRSEELCDLAAEGLLPMLDETRQVFCYTYARHEDGMVREGTSERYTMMSLLGLHRYQSHGGYSPISKSDVLHRLVSESSWVDNVGDLGLLLWTCAEISPDMVPNIYERFESWNAMSRFPDAKAGTTMHMAWYLTGLAACVLSGHSGLTKLNSAIEDVRKRLEENCGSSGVFGHLSGNRSIRGIVRGRIGSFADQVYPTIAFARLSQALRDEKARETALRTANKMCELQGAMGEWFWHYDSVSGTIVSRYPVYSVHQHAMGPMMLFAASEASGADFSAAIARSLRWVDGNNELGLDMVDSSLSLIWRCVHLDKSAAMRDSFLRTAQIRKAPANPSDLKVRYECRPYELGWLLYAFAGRPSR